MLERNPCSRPSGAGSITPGSSPSRFASFER
jgi:hypothetical protein